MRTHTIAEALNTPTEVTALAVTEPGDTPWQAVIPQLTGLVCLHLGRGVDTDPRPVAHWPSSLRELRLDLKAPATLLPRWAKALPGLQILDLRLTDAPAPVPLAALAGFKQLRRLSLTGDGIQDLGPLAALPLERLALACEGADLAPVLTHPTLTTLEGDDALTARWARREALAGLSVQGIQAGLVARAPGTIIGALDALATWVELTSAPRHNTLYGLLGLTPSRDGGSPVEIPVLARALSLPDVSPGLAARVFAACFQSPQDNLAAALEAAEIVIERGTPTAQWALVDAVLAARARYDAGHREYDDSVHDQLLDDLLPRLGAGALVRLLKGLSDDDLDGDELEGLFAAAYAEATPTQTATLDARLRRYVAATRAQNPPSHFEDLLDDIVDVQPEAAERLADLRAPKHTERFTERLQQAARPAEAVAALTALVKAGAAGTLDPEEVGGLFGAVREAAERAAALPPPLARGLAELALSLDEPAWLADEVLLPLVKHAAPWLAALAEPARGIMTRQLAGLQRRVRDWEGSGLLAARARLAGITPQAMARTMVAEQITHALQEPRADLREALDRLAARPFAYPLTRARSRELARKLDLLRSLGTPADTVALMARLRSLRPHLTWAAEDQQYVLTYLLPLAQAEGPTFFAAHVAPWLEGVALVEPRLAYNLACYQAHHGDTPALCAAIEQALALGRPAADFVTDRDFAHRLGEPAVRALLDHGR